MTGLWKWKLTLVLWKIPWTGEPVRLQSMRSQRVGHDWVTSLHFTYVTYRASLVAQMIKNLPAMQETQVWSLGREDTLKTGKATYSSILAWRITWTDKPGRLQSMGLWEVGHDLVTNTHTHTHTHTQYRYLQTISEYLVNYISKSRMY